MPKTKNVICPYCNDKAVLVDSAEVYRKSYGDIWLCRPCQAWVGVHGGSDTPKGSLANKETRAMRVKAHAAFDVLWNNQPSNTAKPVRDYMYEVVARKLRVPKNKAHIANMDAVECARMCRIATETRQQDIMRADGLGKGYGNLD